MTRPRPRAALAALILLAALAPGARGEWLQADASFRDAQLELRLAARDTVGQATPGRLDTLGVALLRLGRLDEADALFRRVLEQSPGDDAAAAGLGKIVLFRGDAARAESLLERPAGSVGGAVQDLFAARLRLGEWKRAAELAAQADQPGRQALLERLAEPEGAWLLSGAERAELGFARRYPVPLVQVKLNGQSVLMGVDTGASDLILDAGWAKRTGVQPLPGQWPVFWTGARTAARGALVRRLDLGGIRCERLPAAVMPLHRWSLEVNPEGQDVAGVIGLNLLRRLAPTLDLKRNVLELRRAGAPPAPGADAVRVPFEVWGESELMVYGTINGGRRMAMVLQTGVPGCAVGAPQDVFDEVGIKPGVVARAVKTAGAWLMGRPWSSVVVPNVTAGAYSRDRVPGWSGALDPGELWRHGVRRDALLGAELLRGERVTLDWDARVLIVE